MTLMNRKNITDDPRLVLVNRSYQQHRRAADDLEWHGKTHYPAYKMHRQQQHFFKQLQKQGVEYHPNF